MIREQLFALITLTAFFMFMTWVLGDIFYQTLNIRLAQIYLFVEIGYAFYFNYQKRQVQKFVDVPFQTYERRVKIQKCYLRSLKLFGTILITGWFFHCPLEDIKEGNLLEFYAACWFYKTPVRLNNEQKNELNNFIKQVQTIIGYEFQKGYNRSVKCMRNSFDEVKCDHRLLAVYISVNILDYFARFYLIYLKGFSYNQAGMMRYFHKKGNIKKQPIVYIHGLGLGVIFNTKLFIGIAEDREIFVVELPWVSQKLGAQIPSSPTKFVQCIEFMLTSHGLYNHGACFVGHSYGSCVITWVLQDNPQIVSSVVLIEPVCLFLYQYKVCYNFLYKNLYKPFELIARFFAAREISTALAMTRYFCWQDNICLYEELADNSIIVLSQNDFIVDSERVRYWLSSHPESNEYIGTEKAKPNRKIQTIWTDKTIDHGHILIDQRLIDLIRNKINETESLMQHKLLQNSFDYPRQN